MITLAILPPLSVSPRGVLEVSKIAYLFVKEFII